MNEAFEKRMVAGGGAALLEASHFFMKTDPVHVTLAKITSKLDELSIPYAIVGGMALVAHGYDRTTVDVDVLVTSDGLTKIHAALEGLGYLPPFENSTQLRDTETSVRIEFLVTGSFPGDGKPKPIAFPDPLTCHVLIDGKRFVDEKTLVELKLASGMSHAGRLKDLADVQELIRIKRWPASYAEQLHPYVRNKFKELWDGVALD